MRTAIEKYKEMLGPSSEEEPGVLPASFARLVWVHLGGVVVQKIWASMKGSSWH